MAYIQNGYVYHTYHDDIKQIPPGTILNTGVNVLEMTKALSLSNEEDFDPSTDPVVDPADEPVAFFDILKGYFFFTYYGFWVQGIHMLAVVCGACTVLWLKRAAYLHIIKMIFDEIKCIVLPIITNIAFGLFCHVFCPMTWYQSGKAYAILLFMPPAILCSTWIRGLCVATRPYASGNLMRQASSMFLWIFIATPAILCGISSAYVICFWIICLSIAMIMYSQVSDALLVSSPNVKLRYIPPSRYQSFLQKFDENIVYMVCLIPCSIVWFSWLNMTLTVVVPMAGKSVTFIPGDVIVSAVLALLVSLPAGTLMANYVYSRMNRVTVKAVAGFILVVLVYTTFFNNVAYTAQRPKRLWLQHVERTFEKEVNGVPTKENDHGIWVSAFDGQGLAPLINLRHPHIQSKHYGKAKCSVENGDCLMSFPWHFPVAESLRDSMYIPTQSPPLPKIPKSQMQMLLSSSLLPINQTQMDRSSREYRYIDITLVGASHMDLVIRDNAGGKRIVAWDISNMKDVTDRGGFFDSNTMSKCCQGFTEKNMVPPHEPRQEGVYFLHIGFGLCPASVCSKMIRLKVRGSQPVEFSAYSHYVDTWLDDRSLQRFHNSLPRWSQNAYFTQFPSILVSKSI